MKCFIILNNILIKKSYIEVDLNMSQSDTDFNLARISGKIIICGFLYIQFEYNHTSHLQQSFHTCFNYI